MTIKYQIVLKVEGEFLSINPTDIHAWASASQRKVTGHHKNPRTHSYMQGQPIIEGLLGPFGNGPDCIRYEDAETYEAMSN